MSRDLIVTLRKDLQNAALHLSKGFKRSRSDENDKSFGLSETINFGKKNFERRYGGENGSEEISAFGVKGWGEKGVDEGDVRSGFVV